MELSASPATGVGILIDCLRQCDFLSHFDLLAPAWLGVSSSSSMLLQDIVEAIEHSSRQLQVLKLGYEGRRDRFPKPALTAILQQSASLRIFELDTSIGYDSDISTRIKIERELCEALVHVSSLGLAKLRLTGVPALATDCIPHWPNLTHLNLIIDDLQGGDHLFRLLECVSGSLRNLSLQFDLRSVHRFPEVDPVDPVQLHKLDTLRLRTDAAEASFRQLIHISTPVATICLDNPSSHGTREIVRFVNSQPSKTVSRIIILQPPILSTS